MAGTEPSAAAEPRDDHLEALVAFVLARHGERIPAEQRERLRESVRGLREAAAALDAHPLTNADEPDAIFGAVQGED
jgi:hypothetical protein